MRKKKSEISKEKSLLVQPWQKLKRVISSSTGESVKNRHSSDVDRSVTCNRAFGK